MKKESVIVLGCVKAYNLKGLRGVYQYLRVNKINYKKKVFSFGLSGSMDRQVLKGRWVNPYELQFHYYSIAHRSRKSGWSYNELRGVKIILLP